jgi:hypothetical protein
MGDKLERIYEYRVLHAKQRELQIPLTVSEQARYGELRSQLPDHVPSLDDRDVYTLLKNPLPAQFVAGGRFGSGTLRNGSAIGFAIATEEEPPALGQRLILHVQEPAQAIEYTFPCRVVSRVVRGSPSMGVALEGVPSQTRSLGRTSGVWHGSPTSARPPRASAANSGESTSHTPPARESRVSSPPARESRVTSPPARESPYSSSSPPARESHYSSSSPPARESRVGLPAEPRAYAPVPASHSTTPLAQPYVAVSQTPTRPSWMPASSEEERSTPANPHEPRRRAVSDRTTQPDLEQLEQDPVGFGDDETTRKVSRNF